MQQLPLKGIRVIDLTRILAGPWSTQNLADLGAEVIKIEKPGIGDDTRQWGPPFVRSETSDFGESSYFLCANRGKNSVTLDFSIPRGADILRSLIRDADVVVENFKVGGLRQYGLDYESLKDINPRLIYCSITGFGQFGPYAQRPGYDVLVQAMCGLMSITGEPDEKGGHPQKVGVAIVDLMTGLYATSAVLAALFERERSGLGQYIDISLFQVGLASLANQASAFLSAGQIPTRLGNAHPSVAPYQPFPTEDGFALFALANDQQFQRFCRGVGREDLSRNSLFKTNADRVRNIARLEIEICQLTKQKTNQEWVEFGERHSLSIGPINDIKKAFDDAHVRATSGTISMLHSRLGKISAVANPMRFSRTPIAQPSAPPVLSSSTDEVLRKAGLSSEQITELRENKII